MMNIHVGNLSPDTTEEDLKKLFSQFGKVKSVKIIKYPSSLSKGYGFIDMPASAEAQEAIQNLKAKDLRGKTISVGEARSRN
jgi:RNA recognition motif-containing protein